MNGALIGRYWEGVGPQNFFYLMPPFINTRGQNELMLVLWPGKEAPELGPVALEVYP